MDNRTRIRTRGEVMENQVEPHQIVSAAIQWKRETDREGVELTTLSESEIHLYRVVTSYMSQRGLKERG